jgi:hypothetical protein
LYLSERNIYGSSRLGMENIGSVIASTSSGNVTPFTPENVVVGDKNFSLTDHRSNVNVIVSDKKIPNFDENNFFSFYSADVKLVQDFYPGGMELFSYGTSSRYNHQGQESDPEIYGEGKSYAYKYRMSDPRLVRMWSIDPMSAKYPYYSPYAYSGNRLIDAIEQEGLQPASVHVVMVNEAGDIVSDRWFEATSGSLGSDFFHSKLAINNQYGLDARNYEYGSHLEVRLNVDAQIVEGVMSYPVITISESKSSTVNSKQNKFTGIPDGPLVGIVRLFSDEMADDFKGTLVGIDNNMDHEKGLKTFSSIVGNTGSVLQAVPHPFVKGIGFGLSAFDDLVQTGLDFKNLDNSEALKNTGIRLINQGAQYGTGKVINNTGGIKLLIMEQSNLLELEWTKLKMS